MEHSNDLILAMPEYLSPSSIDTFNTCPLKYKLSKIDKMSEPPSEASILGNFVHDVLEDLHNIEDPSLRTLQMAKSLLREQWNAKWGELISELVDSEQKLKEFRWKAMWCIEGYFKMEDPATVKSGGRETALYNDINGVVIKGFVDRWDFLDDGISVVDYKTGKSPALKYQEKKFIQLLIYAFILAKELELEAKEVKLLFVKDGVTLAAQVTDENISVMSDYVTKTYEEILKRCKSGNFEPKPNGLCENYCSFRPICPAHNKNFVI